jgi:general secretion pathway protein B
VLAPGRPEIRPPADTEYSADGAQDVMAEPQLDRSMSSVTPPERSANEENLPTLNDVLMQGAGRVPELHLDIHVYTPRPADRFVFINNRKYREGGETPDGTRIERITPDGVVLNHRGLRFLMPRQ